MILCNYCSSACSNNIFVCFTGFFDIVFVIQNKGNHHFPSSCDSAVTYIIYKQTTGNVVLTH